MGLLTPIATLAAPLGVSNILDSALGALGTAVLQRTFLLQTNTSTGIPIPLCVFDAVLEENPTFSADVTEHPVEAGTEVTDHIQLKNNKLKLSGIISNSPLDLSTSIGNILGEGLDLLTDSQARTNILNSGLQQGAGIVGGAILGGAGIGSLGINSFTGGATDAIARTALQSAFQNKSIFDVVTKRQRYTSMVIESMSFPRNTETGYKLAFELEMTAIRIVSSSSVSVSNVAESVANSASSKVSLGSQSTSAVSSATSNSFGGGSILRKLIGG